MDENRIKHSKKAASESMERDMSKAFDRAYARYGTDLAAFFRDAYEEIALRRKELEKCEHPSDIVAAL